MRDWIEEARQRQADDARRFAELEEDLCQLCLARGPDKRNLFVACMYAIHEVVPEAIDLGGVADDSIHGRGYYLRLCKGCRGRLLEHLGQWRAECLALRDLPKDDDGNLEPSSVEHTIPVRVNGAIQWLTREEWEARWPHRRESE